MTTPEDKVAPNGRHFARFAKELMLRIAVPVAIAALVASILIVSYGLNPGELFLPILFGWTPYIASVGYGWSFGHKLYADGWSQKILPLVGYSALITVLHLPFFLLDTNAFRFVPPHALFAFTGLWAFFVAWHAELLGLNSPHNPPPWIRR